jgi:outer membrane protein assembly factor BamB
MMQFWRRCAEGLWNALSSWWTPALIVAFAFVAMTVIVATPVLTGTFGTSGWVMPLEVLAVALPAMLLLWFLVSRRFHWKAKLAAGGLAGLAAATAIAAVREVEVTGDNVLVVHWRWNPGVEERLAAADRLATEDELAQSAVEDAQLEGDSCPGFLGARRDGRVDCAELSLNWNDDPPRELWRFPIGGGYAAFAVKGDVVATIEQQGPREVVSAYDARTGKPIWRRTYAARFSETMGGDGPRATPTIEGEFVYALGATGMLSCLEVRTGRLLWTRNILEDASAENATWGMSGSPLVLGRLVVVNPGGPNGRGLIAYDRFGGDIVWTGGSSKAAYASPTAATLGGVLQVLTLDFDGLAGYEASTGRELWRRPFQALNGISVANPLVLPGDRVFISASYGAGCASVRVVRTEEGWRVDNLWDSPTAMRCKFTSPIYIDGFIYGLDDGVLACLEAETGKRRWKGGRYGHGQILHSERRIFVQCENGEFAVVEADPRQWRESAKFRVLPGEKNWNAPALAGNRLFVRNHFEMAAFELPRRAQSGEAGAVSSR